MIARPRTQLNRRSASSATLEVLGPLRPVSGPVLPSQGVAESEPGATYNTERQAGGARVTWVMSMDASVRETRSLPFQSCTVPAEVEGPCASLPRSGPRRRGCCEAVPSTTAVEQGPKRDEKLAAMCDELDVQARLNFSRRSQLSWHRAEAARCPLEWPRIKLKP